LGNQERRHLVAQNNDNNLYFVGIYVKKDDVERKKPLLEAVGLVEWISNWKLRDHPYLRLMPDHSIEYLTTPLHTPIWYQILVPYQVKFPEGEIIWNSVMDTERWRPEWGREVTDFFTLVVLRFCFCYEAIENKYLMWQSE
jgi:hypothetical protein